MSSAIMLDFSKLRRHRGKRSCRSWVSGEMSLGVEMAGVVGVGIVGMGVGVGTGVGEGAAAGEGAVGRGSSC